MQSVQFEKEGAPQKIHDIMLEHSEIFTMQVACVDEKAARELVTRLISYRAHAKMSGLLANYEQYKVESKKNIIFITGDINAALKVAEKEKLFDEEFILKMKQDSQAKVILSQAAIWAEKEYGIKEEEIGVWEEEDEETTQENMANEFIIKLNELDETTRKTFLETLSNQLPQWGYEELVPLNKKPKWENHSICIGNK